MAKKVKTIAITHLTNISFSAAVGDPALDTCSGGNSPLCAETLPLGGGASCCLKWKIAYVM